MAVIDQTSMRHMAVIRQAHGQHIAVIGHASIQMAMISQADAQSEQWQAKQACNTLE